MKPIPTSPSVRSALLAIAAAALLPAAPITLPPGLNPGDQYRLVFVTEGTRNPLSSNILDYDSFVTDQANSNAALAALNTTWRVIGSTATVSAFDHIGGPFSTRIFNLGGQLVANGSTDLCDGSIGSPIDFDQNGVSRSTLVWTGTSSSCVGFPGGQLGTGLPILGLSSTTSDWLELLGLSSTGPRNFYAISGVLTVPDAPVPEPATMGLLAMGLVGLWWRRPRHKSR